MKFILQLRNDLVTDYTAYPNHPGSPYNLVSVISFIFLFLIFKKEGRTAVKRQFRDLCGMERPAVKNLRVIFNYNISISNE